MHLFFYHLINEKFKFFFLIILFFCCFTKHLYGQKTNKKYTISGYIKELGSQEDLPMVSVFIPNKNLGTSTNDMAFIL